MGSNTETTGSPCRKREGSPKSDGPQYLQSSKRFMANGDPICGHRADSPAGECESHILQEGVIGLNDSGQTLESWHCHVTGCDQSFTDVADYEDHYRSCHSFVCRYCRRFYPTHHLLMTHLLESHDSLFSLLAAKQPMFQCLEESCAECFMDSEKRREHLAHRHGYPANFQFDRRQNQREVDRAGGLEESRDVDAALRRRRRSQTTEPACRLRSSRVPETITFGIGLCDLFQYPGTVMERNVSGNVQMQSYRPSNTEDAMDNT